MVLRSGDDTGEMRQAQWGEFYRFLGGSMRIGNRLSGAVFWAIVAAAPRDRQRGRGRR